MSDVIIAWPFCRCPSLIFFIIGQIDGMARGFYGGKTGLSVAAFYSFRDVVSWPFKGCIMEIINCSFRSVMVWKMLYTSIC